MLDKIKGLFYRPDFFRRQEFTGGQAMKFYSLSILALVIGFSLLLIPAAWGVNRFFESSEWREQKGIIMDLYPDELVLTLEDGTLTTNQSGPVVIPFPAEWRDEAKRDCRRGKRCDRDELPANLLVIDPSATLSSAAFAERDTLILASATEIGFHHPNRGETRIMALSEAKHDKKLTLTSSTFDYWVGRVGGIVQTATLFLMATLPLLMYLGLWLGYLIYSLLGALVVWLAAHLRGHRLTYGRAYVSTLYLLPAPFLVNLVLTTGHHGVPFLFTGILFAMALWNFARVKSDVVPPLPQPVTPAKPASGAPTTPDQP